MKKDGLFQSLTYVVLVLSVNCLILSSPLSETSKVILLILFNFVCSSVVLRVTLEWQDTSNTTRRQGGLNRLASLAAAEKRIAARGEITTSKEEYIAKKT
ncbi:conserved hypothetical conserved phage protein [Citrobacter phage CR44b]|uniref:Conserved hypothetical conserved phage protein n=1 Tax=Citrobacter phage CR44b TaxID=1455075 RepID=W6PNZ7_9CAUD|nr:conserved hypothetical conserved phage protein [Citrobacter phage CR44b]CDM21549.1 conserved hypothetical conserved phage protein [Citrobacter phage CR44b]